MWEGDIDVALSYVVRPPTKGRTHHENRAVILQAALSIRNELTTIGIAFGVTLRIHGRFASDALGTVFGHMPASCRRLRLSSLI
jgi:hypothetical protein